jgi:hypothetical protein
LIIKEIDNLIIFSSKGWEDLWNTTFRHDTFGEAGRRFEGINGANADLVRLRIKWEDVIEKSG